MLYSYLVKYIRLIRVLSCYFKQKLQEKPRDIAYLKKTVYILWQKNQ